jgi:hypothetical protein
MVTVNQEIPGQYLQLAVPERHYLTVLHFLARLDASEKGQDSGTNLLGGLKTTPSGRVKVSSRPAKKWTPSELTQLKHEIMTKRKCLAPLFELMSAAPGVHVMKADYVKDSGFKGSQLRSALAGISQYIGKRFERSNWPFGREWNLNGSGETSYFMTVEQAEQWNRA